MRERWAGKQKLRSTTMETTCLRVAQGWQWGAPLLCGVTLRWLLKASDVFFRVSGFSLQRHLSKQHIFSTLAYLAQECCSVCKGCWVANETEAQTRPVAGQDACTWLVGGAVFWRATHCPQPTWASALCLSVWLEKIVPHYTSDLHSLNCAWDGAFSPVSIRGISFPESCLPSSLYNSVP